ncbi:hypothetical protein H2200_008560 [Cladophialophora chaetospira]|uniref:Uncharacterized protein n=1 Tax=Cladophialophora chaetospira TaxID=386627 RepID=A0AA38X4A0_9EURO|nr:hypothetical protein H2200_008560 [Cladophialophora chaetospira]
MAQTRWLPLFRGPPIQKITVGSLRAVPKADAKVPIFLDLKSKYRAERQSTVRAKVLWSSAVLRPSKSEHLLGFQIGKEPEATRESFGEPKAWNGTPRMKISSR